MRWDSDGEGQYEIQADAEDGPRHRSDPAPARGRQGISGALAPAAIGAQVFGSLEHSHHSQRRARPRRPSTRPRRSGRARNPNSTTRTTRRSTSTLPTTPRSARLGAQQGRGQHRIYLAAVPAEARALRFVRARAEAAAFSCTSSACSSWTRRRNCCRRSCASCADSSTPPICR